MTGEAPTPKPRVMVIDDERSIRLAMRRFFERRGWEMHEAEDGLPALEILLADDAPHFDAIISDLKMPGLGGMELHARLKAERPDLVKRLILSTGDATSPEAASFLAGSGCLVIEKPFELSVLAATVEQLRSRAQ